MNDKPTTSLAIRPAVAVEPWRGATWQRLWLALQAKPWASLAIVPASAGAPSEFATSIANTLARTGMIHLAAPIHIADATDVQLSNVMAFMDDIRHCRQDGYRILIALAPMSQNPVTESIAQSADASLLCLLFEQMVSGEAMRTVQKIGKDRFIGSAIFRPDATPA